MVSFGTHEFYQGLYEALYVCTQRGANQTAASGAKSGRVGTAHRLQRGSANGWAMPTLPLTFEHAARRSGILFLPSRSMHANWLEI